MLRKFMLSLALLAAIGFAVAQTQIDIDPTEGTGEDQISKGPLEASVEQTVQLILPMATALHLDASTITFDLQALDGTPGWAERARDGTQPANFDLACVYVTGDDVTQGFNNQTQVVPGGIAYAADAWNKIHLIYHGNNKSGIVPDSARVVNYPPLRLDAEGELIPESKNYFVCYQTFVMQLFSNLDTWDLSVERLDTTDQGIEHLYIQANTCANFGVPTGLYDLPNTESRSLIPSNLVVGPTGDHVNEEGSQCTNTNSSWLDVLGVLAVKINSDQWGTSTANLTYTLMSPDPNPAP